MDVPVPALRTSEVFGIAPKVRPYSYVDRGELDRRLRRELSRESRHVALRGVSKSGKSWLRQEIIGSMAVTVQCRLDKSARDLYVDALSQLDIHFKVESRSGDSLSGTAEATGEVGVGLLAKIGVRTSATTSIDSSDTYAPVGKSIEDLRHVVEILAASDKVLVIEDFHYLSIDERRKFAFDLKAMWDYGFMVVIIGVWSKSNMLTFMNSDLTGRVSEIPLVWVTSDLRDVFRKGGEALNIQFAEPLVDRAIEICYGNAGILQQLILETLEQSEVFERSEVVQYIDNLNDLESAAMFYAEDLNSLYQQFAERVSSGIRKRKNSTGIYAHAMAAILEMPDEDIINGVSLDTIFGISSARESRIQKGNLAKVLERIEGLQVDDNGRGLVLAYNEGTKEVSVVDRQLLLYRRYSTVAWPWEDLIREAESSESAYEQE